MNTEKIRAFVNAVECGSFTAAARKQNKAQSWVSNAIADLEIDLNLTLFDRSAYKPILTSEGQTLLLHAKNLLSAETAFLNRAHHLSDGVEERIVVAVDDWLMNQDIRLALVEFQTTFPSVELVIRQLMTQDIIHLIEENEVDVALANGRWFLDKSVQFQTLDYIETCLICSKNNPMGQKKVAHSDLVGTKQISRTSAFNLENKYLDLPDIEHINVDDMESVITLVENDIGWAFIPKEIALNHLSRIKIVETLVSEKGHLLRVELITSELRANGIATQWLKNKLATLY
ncbi:LysR family transcriptional regulator [Vibrio breoganii]